MVSEVSNMSKFCVFCGKKPENKNKEHIIPQWLSKHTGRFDKICHMNESTTSAKIPFCSLTFPACTKCNDAFGKMEAAVKPILLDIKKPKIKLRLLPLLSGRSHINDLKIEKIALSVNLIDDLKLDKDFIIKFKNRTSNACNTS